MNWPHLHLLLNHVPMLGCLFGLFLLLLAWLRGNRGIMSAALWLFLVAAVAAIPTFYSGHESEDAVEHLPGISEHLIDQHEDAANVSLAGVEVLGLASLASLLVIRKGRNTPGWLAALVLILAIATSAAMIWTANLGGQIRHTEIRSGRAAPVRAPDH